jgi:hypothetical protein
VKSPVFLCDVFTVVAISKVVATVATNENREERLEAGIRTRRAKVPLSCPFLPCV